jgi:hypothetical protein
MRAIGIGVWTRPLNMNVRSSGALFSRSSLVCAYSNSNPTITRPVPIAKPFTDRVFGVEFVPRKPVTSADAFAGSSRKRKKVKGKR